jgi:hypothetical protein
VIAEINRITSTIRETCIKADSDWRKFVDQYNFEVYHVPLPGDDLLPWLKLAVGPARA